jgi:hypothetical protein
MVHGIDTIFNLSLISFKMNSSLALQAQILQQIALEVGRRKVECYF